MADPTQLLDRLHRRTARLVFVGQGYVGLPLALRASEVGFPTVGFDVDEQRIEALRAARSYVGDVADAALAAALERGYQPTADPADLAGFDVAVVTVPTPLHDGTPDLGYIEQAARTLADHLRPGAAVVLESTTYPGTTEELFGPILAAGSGLEAGRDFFLGYSPERVDPGNRTWTIVNTPKVVSGVDPASLAVVGACYDALVDTTVPVASCAEAEMTKLLENTFRHVNIALVNELATFADQLGVDIWRVIDAASTKPFGFMKFTPGPGVGGHCLPVDPSYLAWRVEERLGLPFRFVSLANDVNSSMPSYVVSRAHRLLADQGCTLDGARVLLLGLSFKRGTSDCRESPSLEVAAHLAAAGAVVTACDPYVSPLNRRGIGFPMVDFTAEALARADLTILLVDHDEFVPTTVATHARLVLDTKGVLRSIPFVGDLL